MTLQGEKSRQDDETELLDFHGFNELRLSCWDDSGSDSSSNELCFSAGESATEKKGKKVEFAPGSRRSGKKQPGKRKGGREDEKYAAEARKMLI